MGQAIFLRRVIDLSRPPAFNGSYPADNSGDTNATFMLTAQLSSPGDPESHVFEVYVDGTLKSTSASTTDLSYSYTTTTLSAGSHTAYFTCTNDAGTVTSRTATLTVTEAQRKPVLDSSKPANATITFPRPTVDSSSTCTYAFFSWADSSVRTYANTTSGSTSTTLSVSITTPGVPASYTYQWYKDGAAISGATSASYSYTPSDEGSATFYCKVTNSAGSVNSRTATVTAAQSTWCLRITGTGTLKFSKLYGKKLDWYGIGGGGSGGCVAGGTSDKNCANGGGSGYARIKNNYTCAAGTTYTVTVGAGGAAVATTSSGNNGAATTVVTGSTTILSAAGGKKGSYNGAGGNGGCGGGKGCYNTTEKAGNGGALGGDGYGPGGDSGGGGEGDITTNAVTKKYYYLFQEDSGYTVGGGGGGMGLRYSAGDGGGKLYSDSSKTLGGDGGRYNSGKGANGRNNFGGGGGGGHYSDGGSGRGGSGVVFVRGGV